MLSSLTSAQMPLNIAILGTIQVRLGDEYLSQWEFERVRALLVYLVVERMPHERSRLAYLFWPDAPFKTGLQNVRQTLAALRRVLRDKEQAVPCLVTTTTTIAWNPERQCSLDVDDWLNVLNQTEQHNHRRLSACSTCVAQLEQANALYRGDFARGLAVDSEPFEDWLLPKQQQFHAHAVHTLNNLTDYYLRHDQPAKAIQMARQQVALDPLSDAGHHQLIQALAGDNQRHAALQHCVRYKALLETELMTALPGKTVALHRQLSAASWEPSMACRAPRHNLPKPLTVCLGYAAELRQIRERLASTHCRLLTVSGLAGSGKTRIAIEAVEAEAANFQDGVCFVELEAIGPNELLPTIATALLLAVNPAQPVLEQLRTYLQDKELLLVLDHFDPLVQRDTPILQQLLRNAPGLHLLLTSRERLLVPGEVCVELRGLEYPPCPTAADFEQYDAVRLLFQHIGRWQPMSGVVSPADRAAVWQICRNVGGNPRALELYVQAMGIVPLAEINAAFDYVARWGDLVSRTAPPGQGSLRAMFYAAWRGLDVEERRALTALATFEQSFTAAAAQAVAQCGPNVLLRLQATSCLQVIAPACEPSGMGSIAMGQPARYRLPELLRFYLWKTLQQEPIILQQLQRKQALYCMNFLRHSVEAFTSERGRSGIMYMLRQEQDNIDQALVWTKAAGVHVLRARIEQDLLFLYMYETRYCVATVTDFIQRPAAP